MKKEYLLRISIFTVTLLLIFNVYSCKKGAGEGGRASIKGKVFTTNYNSSFSLAQDSGYLGGQKVYIIYGDEIAVGDNQDTNNEGEFEFRYLRKGNYKVYVYTKVNSNHLDSAIVKVAEITGNKQTVEVPEFRIKTSKN